MSITTAINSNPPPSPPTPRDLCNKCIHLTTDHKFHHPSTPIPLNGRLSHRLSYTNESRFFFKLPWECNDVWPGLPGLQASFLKGCAVCGVIRAGLIAAGATRADSVVADSEVSIRAEYGFEDQRQRKPTGVVFDYQFVGETQWHRTPQQPTFVLAALRGNNPASRQFRSISSIDPLSPENKKTIKSWINTCKNSHEYCQLPTPTSAQPLPTRVIDVQPANPTLVSTTGKSGTYATLSYCWGLSPSNPWESMYTTTSATLTSQMGGIIFDELPKTLQDAVLVTRALGLKYLWIDALCIIQDSPLDVQREIAAMDSVYGNCEVVICATTSSSSQSGFLNPRRDVEPLVNIPFIPCEGGEGGVYGFYDTTTFPARNDWQGVEKAEWNKRAWTFQERVVPPRVLHFSTTTLRLECRTSDFSELECTPRRVVVGNSVLGNDYRYLGVLERLAAQEPLDKLEIYETYYKFACEYSKRSVSFEKDREAAFGAVVVRFGRLVEGGNKSGVPYPSKHTNSPWPSWSWYSSPNAVSWIHSSKIWKSASPASLLPQGANSPVLVSYTAAGGELVISAVLREVEMEIGKGGGGGAYILHKGERYGTLDLDTKLDSCSSQDASTAAAPPQRPRIWLLQLRNKYQIFDDKGGSTMCWAAGLVLEPVVGGGGRDGYRRVGIFGVYSREKWEELFEGRGQTQIKLV
ncbi:hypothetical protein VF21_00301 [Pseudogymnoascus sp. 05NY08]|nr:hypothetical protein VF21_00301 [Pseudogymnoascus sp. 05NY08]